MATMSWAGELHTVKVFFRWLHRHDVILVDPFERIDIPRRGHTLPTYLTQTEMKKLLTSTPADEMLRDRAVLEVLYSSGLRIGELVRLELRDIDLSGGVIFIRQGKGKKDRVVPVGQIACTLVSRYIREVRVATRSQSRVLFVTHEGWRMNESHVRTYILLPAIRRAEIDKHVTLHVLRHSCAIHLLENGASVRYIQSLLGHVKLETTQKYLAVVPTELKKVHSASHPSEHQRRPEPVTPSRRAPSKWDALRKLREDAHGDDPTEEQD